MYLAYTRRWLNKIKKINRNKRNKKKFLYLSWIIYQIVLPSIHTPLIKVNIFYLNHSTSMVLFWLLPFSFLEELLLLLVFWDDLVFRFCNLGGFSIFQKSDILSQNFIPELLQVLWLLLFFLLLYKLLLFSFLSYFGLGYLLGFLSSILNTTDLCYLFQLGLELLLLFMSLLHLLSLLFKHLSIVLGNIRENKEKHNNTEEKWKKFLFIYILLI